MPQGYSLNCLSPNFFVRYPHTQFPEIEYKPGRPYMILIVKIENNTFAIPFRTNITHNNCYHFKNTTRQSTGKGTPGLDFSKAVVIDPQVDIGAPAQIDAGEYQELSNKSRFIIEKFKTYVRNYIKVQNGQETKSCVARNYNSYCTLKYFHKELGIS